MHHERAGVPCIRSFRKIAEKRREVPLDFIDEFRPGLRAAALEIETNLLVLVHQDLRERANGRVVQFRRLLGLQLPASHIEDVLKNARHDACKKRSEFLRADCGLFPFELRTGLSRHRIGIS